MSLSRRFGLARLIPVFVLPAVAFALSAASFRDRELARADFVFNNGGEVTSLDPATSSGVPEGRVVRALFEGLYVRNPATLAPEGALAEKSTVSDDKLHYTFTIRQGARWSNGDPVTARDFEWNFRRVLEPQTASPFARELWCVVGAREFNTGKDAQGADVAAEWSSVGIRALDDRTLELRLAHPMLHVYDLLACYQLAPVHPASFEEASRRWPGRWQSKWMQPEHLVVNGPFKLVLRRINDRIRLAKNPDYWDADRVAFRTIDVLAIDDANTAFNLYTSGEIDWLDATVPSTLISRLKPQDDFTPLPYFGAYFYRVNTTKPPLDDKRVRRALSAAINRDVICERVLKAGQTPLLGLMPWGRMAGYTSPTFRKEDSRNARMILKQAGFGVGARPFPKLELLYNTSEQHRDVAELIADQWERGLGIEVALRNQEWKSYVDAQNRMQYDLSRSSWIADYGDPTAFLRIFTSDNPNNRTGWKNERYDQLIAAATVERDVLARDELLRQAETILIDESPILPIYSYVSQNLVNPRLGGFTSNPLNDQNPKFWYWMSDDELAQARKRAPASEIRVDSRGPRDGLYAPAIAREMRSSSRAGGARGDAAQEPAKRPGQTPTRREPPKGSDR